MVVLSWGQLPGITQIPSILRYGVILNFGLADYKAAMEASEHSSLIRQHSKEYSSLIKPQSKKALSAYSSLTPPEDNWKPSVFDFKAKGRGSTCPTCRGLGRIPKGEVACGH